jgi:hypothetical protein
MQVVLQEAMQAYTIRSETFLKTLLRDERNREMKRMTTWVQK